MRSKHNPVRAAQQSYCNGLDAEFWDNVEHVVSLGAGEIYIQLGARFLIRTEIESLLRRYRRLDPAIVAALRRRWWK
jgi:hypothetical protein